MIVLLWQSVMNGRSSAIAARAGALALPEDPEPKNQSNATVLYGCGL
jgi:hypothetical protein